MASLAVLLLCPGPPAPRAKPSPMVLAPHPRILLDPAALAALRAHKERGDPAWIRLRTVCDSYLPGSVEWPDGDDFPPPGMIGEGYQGSGYFEALLSLALCFQAEQAGAPERAARYAAKGVEVLMKMSEPEGPHAVDPLRDSGYGIRFFGVGMALGYDWLYQALRPPERARVSAALNRWIGAFDEKGFGREHPQGNYFAGYYAAKALAAIATHGDNRDAEPHLIDFLVRLHGKMVQPYYAAHLAGGGWPEGWNYGPTATLNMSWPALAARTALGLDLIHDPRAPFLFPIEQGLHLIHFSWPSRRTLDDRQIQYASDNPSSTSPSLYTAQAYLSRVFSDPAAPYVQSFARAVRAVHAGGAPPWQEILFWEESAPEKPFSTLPLSYLARGMNLLAMRSSWDTDAVFGSFISGAYINYEDSGEQYFDQGSLAVMNGDRPLLVNAAAALLRNTTERSEGAGLFDLIHKDVHKGGSRTLFNIFYANLPRPYGQAATPPDKARTSIAAFEDEGDYVLARGANLEDMYRRGEDGCGVASWTRTIVYIRPPYFVIHDRTEVIGGPMDQWLAFHVASRPVPSPYRGRFDIGSGPSRAGLLSALLPADARVRVVDVFGRGKVFRLEVRPGAPGAKQEWLTLVEARRGSERTWPPRRISAMDGNVLGGRLSGVELLEGDESRVVIFAGSSDELRYATSARSAVHIIVGLPAGESFVPIATHSGARHVVRITKGPGMAASPAGTLRFHITASGTITMGAASGR